MMDVEAYDRFPNYKGTTTAIYFRRLCLSGAAVSPT